MFWHMIPTSMHRYLYFIARIKTVIKIFNTHIMQNNNMSNGILTSLVKIEFDLQYSLNILNEHFNNMYNQIV